MAEKNKESLTSVPSLSATPSGAEGTRQSSDKGKGILVEQDVVNLMDLKPQDLNKPLEVKVYKKWASRNVPDPNPTGLCFILLDKQVFTKDFTAHGRQHSLTLFQQHNH